MNARRHRRLAALTFAVLVAVGLLLQALGAGETGLLYLAPALLMAVPLLLGRYVGERHIAALAGRPRPRARRRRAAAPLTPRGPRRAMLRGGRLVGSSLAKRPPPAAALSLPA
ncbi:hypothetical protein FSW04_19470 [Baekduia soli]|uniref:Uncharacterized protein n=1 Tax=Baekduia soli TaxID=496014 RepID=A0A5B8U8Z1_9ACTN|nr:hypothetical protein [Baekduia soli]QEC49534.1 hypothetical protein FSW04_19470 [Baekduia soli]